MRKDPIVAQIHAEREAIARANGYDMKRIVADLRASEQRRAASPSTKRTGTPSKRATSRKRRAA